MERCGIEAARYPLLAALRGDTSDNLPGVPGVGEKTAAKLFAQYRDFDDLYAHLDALTPKLRENLATFEERARNNERVMRLVRDVPLDFTLDDITLGGWNRQEVNGFFERYEMNSLRARMGKLMQDGLLGEGVGEITKPVAAPSRAATPTPAPKGGATLDQIFAGPVAPLVAFNDERVAGFNTSSLALGVFEVKEFLRGVAGRPFAGHDVKGLYRVADEIGCRPERPRG